MLILKPLLKGEHSRILEEHHGKTSGENINQGIVSPLGITVVGHLSEVLSQGADHGAKLQMFWAMSHGKSSPQLRKEYNWNLSGEGKRPKR